MIRPLPQNYDSRIAEPFWQNQWEQDHVYTWDANVKRDDSFVIDTPPPTVSGLLHMGHIFSYTQADFVARFQRMIGKNVFYPMGFDDNGLPTERLVEKVKNIRAVAMPRAEFIAVCKEVVASAEDEFRALFRSVALSVDWSQEYQTISPNSQAISQLSFLELAGKDQAYRRMQPTLWDPVDQTALAQADIEDKELPSQMNDIRFGTEKGEAVTIATTRPELLGACVAVLFHPDDARYQYLKGQHAITPLFQVKVPFIADTQVDPEKGTGLVMCCTFGDMTDIDWWRTHKLPLRVILDKAGRLDFSAQNWIDTTNPHIQALQGIKVKEARAKIIELLKDAGLLLKQVELQHVVKCAERSGAPLEILVTPQWFIRVLDHKDALLKKANECVWHPAYMKLRLEQWIQGLSWDWCISRQRFFGVPFPVWYSKRAGEEGKIILADPKKLPVDPLADLPEGYSRDEVEGDRDVMDTWATSSVSPQLSSRGINGTYALDAARHAALFPADLRPQAHEIIRSWAFYTIVKAHLHQDSIPWKHLMISGWCLAADKTKMSKSKGNVVTPVHLIEEKGADVVRYWASTSRLGADTAYSEDVLKIGKKLVNKIWNAAKFAAIHLEKLKSIPNSAVEDVAKGTISEPIDLWVLTRLHKSIKKATESFLQFEYCDARVAVEDFFWNDFCDNYLEIVKVRAYDEAGTNPTGQQSAVHTIYHCLDGILRLFAPFVPHVTEALYSHIFDHRHTSIHAKGNWPDAALWPCVETAENQGKLCVAILNVVRKVKADQNISLKTPVAELQVQANDAETLQNFQAIRQDLQYVTNALLCQAVEKVSATHCYVAEGESCSVGVVLE